MTNSRIAKLAAFSAGTVAALSFATSVGAVTVAELQAQINLLMAQLQSLQGTPAQVSTTTFTTDLTVGSTGDQVVALQSFLESKGYLVMPVGVAKGYFGGLTRAAVARYQAANAISPAAGYFGPVTRGSVNAVVSVVVPGGTSTGGTVGTGGTSGVITTPGVEGTLTATLNATPASAKLYEGDSKKAVLGIKLEARTSDIKVERVRLDLGTNTEFYRKIASRAYLMDGSTVLASADLNSDTVVKDGSNYIVTLSGFGYVVPKDSTRVLTVALDAYDNIDSTLTDGDSWTVTVPTLGVRGIDGAGIDQTTPTSSFGRSFTSESDVAENASLKISLNTNSPSVAHIIASEGTDDNELDELELLKFDVKAEKDAVTLTEITASTTLTGAADAATFYLMDGNTVLASETGTTTAGTLNVVFDDLDYTVSKDSTRTLTIAVDIRNADASNSTLAVSVTSAVAENSFGDNVTVTGTATGSTQTITSTGAELSLSSKPISKSTTDTQSTAQATFNVNIKALGDDVVASTTGAFLFQVYENGVASTTLASVSGVYSAPSANVSGDNITISEGNNLTIPVNVLVSVPAGTASKFYSFGLKSFTSDQGVTNYMNGDLDWRTDAIVLP